MKLDKSSESQAAHLGAGAEDPSQWMLDGVRTGDTCEHHMAILVVHGMGQQSRLDTVSGFSDGLRETLLRLPIGARPNVELHPCPASQAVGADGTHAEFMAFDVVARGTRRVLSKLHVYEAYWAPLTEGVTTLRDVTAFLLRAASKSLWARVFKRFIYDKRVTFPIPFWTALHLVLASLVVVSLIGLNALIAYVVAKQWLSGAPEGQVQIATLTKVMVLVALGLVAFAIPIFVSMRFRFRPWQWVSLAELPTAVLALVFGAGAGGLVTYASGQCATAGLMPLYCTSGLKRFLDQSWGPFVLYTLVLVLVIPAAILILGIVVEFVTTRLVKPQAPIVEDATGTTSADGAKSATSGKPAEKEKLEERTKRSFHITRGLTVVTVIVIALGLVYLVVHGLFSTVAGPPADVATPAKMTVFVVWAVLLWLSGFVRSVMVQYVGDVSVYVSSHRLDRFFDTRLRIKEVVDKQLRLLYGIRVNEMPVYESVMVVGHSLGSLVGYDALNRYIAEDETRQGTNKYQRVRGRTPLFLTFGSPLDKTAFLFTRETYSRSPTRSALAATFQPMLLQPTLRPRRWINVWSPWDIISGPLEYYDLPEEHESPAQHEARIVNCVDRDASTLLAAHVQYWRNTKIYRILLRAVERQVGLQDSSSDDCEEQPRGTVTV